MRNARLGEAQGGIKIAGRNISNLRYADDTILMAESEEESQKVGLKLNIQKTKIMASGHFMGNRWENRDTFYFLFKITADGDCSHEIKRHLLLGS